MSRVYPFDDAATARAVIDEDGTLTEWNEGARRLLGHPAEEVVGRPAALLLAGDVTPRAPVGARLRSWRTSASPRSRTSSPSTCSTRRRAAATTRPG
ncbi:PAS domain S-box protein [Streptomyces sp. NBC_00631]|uniref:PAS domain S-box protein n=1 Tax=Streptomyces sp. NBC_00631 TaxID=2975793 RepID=UPI003869190B